MKNTLKLKEIEYSLYCIPVQCVPLQQKLRLVLQAEHFWGVSGHCRTAKDRAVFHLPSFFAVTEHNVFNRPSRRVTLSICIWGEGFEAPTALVSHSSLLLTLFSLSGWILSSLLPLISQPTCFASCPCIMQNSRLLPIQKSKHPLNTAFLEAPSANF